jgi:formylglycine-generating enzyme required for sulfatase activity
MAAVWKRLAVGLLLVAIADLGWSGEKGQPEEADPASGQNANSGTTATGQNAIVNSIGIKLVRIPAGEFLMGSRESTTEMRKSFPQYDAERFEHKFDDEYPLHRVRITKSFYLGATAVTVGQFRRFVGETNFKTDAERSDPANDTPGEPRRIGPGGYGYNKETGRLDERRNPKHTWRDTGFPQGENHPVVDVSWNDAVAFCKWLGEKERKHYRLPTEAEWEYACRAGTTTRYWCGDDPQSLLKNANIYDQSSAKVFPEWSKYALPGDDRFPFTAPVASFQPNPFGLYDMHGNVWQWCSDFYGKDYYAKSPVDDPQGPATERKHVRRGGAWHSWPLYCRAAFRNYNTPQSRYFNLGFRVALEGR